MLVRVYVLYCVNGTCKCFVLWQCCVYMLCTVIMVRVHVIFCDVLRVHVLYCVNGTCKCFVLWQRYVHMLRIVIMVRVHVMFCDVGACTWFVLWQWKARKMFENHCSRAHVVLPPDHLERGVNTSSCHNVCPHLLYWFLLYNQRPWNKKNIQSSY